MGCQYECSVILMEYNAWIGVIIQCLHHQQDFGRECCATQKWPNFTYSIPFRLRVSPSRSSDVSAALLRHKASMMGDWFVLGLPWWFSGKESTCQCRRGRFDPWVGKIPLRRNSNPLQYPCLGNPMDRGVVWWAAVHGATEELDIT